METIYLIARTKNLILLELKYIYIYIFIMYTLFKLRINESKTKHA